MANMEGMPREAVALTSSCGILCPHKYVTKNSLGNVIQSYKLEL